jgi:Flp pilus assembly protein TadD
MLMRCMMAVMLFLSLARFGFAYPQEQNGNGSSAKADTVLARINEPEEEEAARNGKATVAVEQLQMPDKAWKEVHRGIAAMRAGNEREAAEHFEKMVAIDPGLPVGHNALGVIYTDLKEYDKAEAEFQKAVAIKPNYRLAMDNVTVVLCLQHRYAEAEPVARRALDMEPEAPSSQYLLGSILVQEGHHREEAERLLLKVKERYPRAWLFLAKNAVDHGETEEAAADVREYLRCPLAMETKLATDWLETLDKQVAARRNGAPADVGGAGVSWVD